MARGLQQQKKVKKKMKKMINTTFHGIGFVFILLGFIMCLGAAGNSDLGQPLVEVSRMLAAGLASCIGGGFLVWWTV